MFRNSADQARNPTNTDSENLYWKDLETMQRYVRMAGIEVVGATEKLKILSDSTVMGEVINLFTLKK